MSVQVTIENLSTCKEALTSLSTNRVSLHKTVTEYPVECEFPGYRTVLRKPEEVDDLIASLASQIRALETAPAFDDSPVMKAPEGSPVDEGSPVTPIAKAKGFPRKAKLPPKGPMTFDREAFGKAMKNHFPSMGEGELKIITDFTVEFVHLLTGFISGRRSATHPTVLNQEIFAEYAALVHVLETMNATGEKSVMDPLRDAAERATRPVEVKPAL